MKIKVVVLSEGMKAVAGFGLGVPATAGTGDAVTKLSTEPAK
jgi:hypothetical protein